MKKQHNRPYGGGFIYAVNDYATIEQLRDEATRKWDEMKAENERVIDTRPTWRRIASHIYWRSELPKIMEWVVGIVADIVRDQE